MASQVSLVGEGVSVISGNVSLPGVGVSLSAGVSVDGVGASLGGADSPVPPPEGLFVMLPQLPGSAFVGPLDIVSGAVVAFSQRAMSAALRGTALYTITDGVTPQSFNSDATTGDAPTADILTFLDGGTGNVTLWNDQSGNTSNVIQATAELQPQWSASGPGGRPGIAYTAANMATAGNVTFDSNDFAVFVVFRTSTTGNFFFPGINVFGSAPDFGVWWNGFPSLNVLEIDTGTDSVDFASGSGDYRDKAVSSQDDTFYVYDTYWDETSGTAALNGAALSVAVSAYYGDGTTGPISEVLCIGGPNAAPESTVTGFVVEVLMYAKDITPEDRVSIRENMAAYYGISL